MEAHVATEACWKASWQRLCLQQRPRSPRELGVLHVNLLMLPLVKSDEWSNDSSHLYQGWQEGLRAVTLAAAGAVQPQEAGSPPH